MSMTPHAPPFYDHGCRPGRWYKWPAVAARRLLRRTQRPFFYSLEASVADLRRELTLLRAEADASTRLHAETAAVADRGRDEAARRHAELTARVGAILNDQSMPPAGACAVLDDLEWAARSARAGVSTGRRPPRVLFAVSSGSQMYSGVGRAIVEVAKRVRGRIDYEFAIDNGNGRNVEILSRFCREQGLPLHVGRVGNGCGDAGNADLPELLARGGWDAVECVSFANAATNGAILDHAGDLPIVYTPHYQPMWTVPVTPDRAREIDAVHGELLRRAAVVACDSPWEWLTLRAAASPGVDCALLPLGFDPAQFTPGRRDRRPYLLFVGDQVETRKRFPLTLDVFAEVLKRHPGLQLVVVGNKSDEITGDVPAAVRRQCVLMGYVSEAELRTLYREAAGLLLLSDYEAFGLPILEALACGTPVFLSRRPTVAGLFGRYKGAVFIDDAAPDRMAESIVAALARGGDLVAEALADRPRLEADLSWDKLAAKRCQALEAALAGRAVPPLRIAA